MSELVPTLKQRFWDSNGAPLVGGKLYSYQAGTSTPLATYTDESGVTPNTNPIILDANGEADIWMGSQTYKFTLTDANGVVQWTTDNVVAPGSSTALAAAVDSATNSATAAAASATAAAASATAAAASATAAAASATAALDTVTGSRSVPQSIVAGTGIAFTGSNPRNLWFIKGTGGVTVTKNPQIAVGNILGQRLTLFGTSDTDFVKIQDGTGLDLNGTWIGGNGSRLVLSWDGSLWSEESRR